MALTFQVVNGTQATTSPTSKVAVTTSTLTLLQIKAPAASAMRVIEWGISFDAVVTTPIECELITSSTVFATVTTFAATDIVKLNGPNDSASLIQTGTSASGFTSTAEGTATSAYKTLDYQLVQQSYFKQFPLGREPAVIAANGLRVRVTGSTGSTPNATCYISWEE